jgi:Spy/CpxP family protein refolding chaperone
MKRFKVLPMTLAMLSLIVVVGLAPSAFARPQGAGFDRLTRLEAQMDSLNLDAATSADVHSIIDTARATQSDLHTQLRQAYQALRQSMQAEPLPDPQAVSQQLDTIGNLQATYQKTMTLAWLEAVGKLTPAQRASLRTAMQSHGAGKSSPVH